MTTLRALRQLSLDAHQPAQPVAKRKRKNTALKRNIDSLVDEIRLFNRITTLERQIKEQKEVIELEAVEASETKAELETSSNLVWLSSLSNSQFAHFIADFLVEGTLPQEQNGIKAQLKKDLAKFIYFCLWHHFERSALVAMIINLNRLPSGSITAKNLRPLAVIALNLADQCLDDRNVRFSDYSGFFGNTPKEMRRGHIDFLNAIKHNAFNGVGESQQLFNEYVKTLCQSWKAMGVEEAFPFVRLSL